MPHIVIDARIINSSTGRYVERLLHYLQDIDAVNRYTVLIRSKDIDFWKPTNKNFSVVEANFDNYSFGEQLGFKKLLNSLSPDLVHFCMPQQPILYRGKKVTTFHDLTLIQTYNSDKNWLAYRLKQQVGKFVFKMAAHSNAHIVTPTKFTKQALVEFAGIAPSKVTVTYEAADVLKIAPVAYAHPFKQFIMYVGQQSDYKNLQRLGDAHQKLLEKHPDLGLILVGKKDKAAEKNEHYFTKQNYKNIKFTGFIDDAQKDWLYTNTAAYVFPSLMEGFGLPGLEAMNYGAPVVSSSATCLPEVYGEAAYYFDPTDTDDMVRAIDEVLSNEALQNKLVTNGYNQVKKYSWKKMAEQTHAVYMSVLQET